MLLSISPPRPSSPHLWPLFPRKSGLSQEEGASLPPSPHPLPSPGTFPGLPQPSPFPSHSLAGAPSCPSGHLSVHPSLYSTHSFLLDTVLKA